MAKNYRAPGDKINVTAPSGGLTSGQGYVASQVFTVIETAAAENVVVAANVRGIFELAVLSTDVVAVGDRLWWDDGNSRLTKTASTHLFAGTAANASPNGVAVVELNLNAGVSANT